MVMAIFARRGDPYQLVVSMTGVKMGERMLQIGCADGGRLGAVAAKVGFSGNAVAVVTDENSAVRARKGAAGAGALVEVKMSTPARLPVDSDAFDLAVIDDTGGFAGMLTPEARVAMLREVLRALRPGGRALVIGAAPRGGLGALVSRAQAGPGFDAVAALSADGFKPVRKLAEREGLTFVEGIKPRHS
jgi:ubiquinone/menaquinone biosynthesis C-methylase UbiE